MKIVAYDTSILLDISKAKEWFFNGWDKVIITNITWQELKQIKDNKNKTEEVRRRARELSKLFNKHMGNIIHLKYTSGALENSNFYVNNDDRILLGIEMGYKKSLEEFGEELEFYFYTSDLFQYCDAVEKGIPAQLFEPVEEIQENYKGFKEFYLTDEEWINFYAQDEFYEQVLDEMLINEYLIIHYHDKDNEKKEYCAKKIKYTLDGEEFFELEELCWPEFHSSKLDDMKPKDCYQRCAMDALLSSNFVILRGKPGSGKTLASLSYIFHALDGHEYNKIYMIVNPVATRDSARLGFLPGDKNDKILDSSIGSLLAAKLGDRIGVDYLIDSHKLELLPASDIRGVSIPKDAICFVTEGQNLTKDLMKLIIQRCEEGCKLIIEGDNEAQVDMEIYDGKNNGLRRAVEVFKGEDFFSTVTLEEIYRSRAAKVAEQM
jgi:predicted ribonuclease YlaK